MAIETIHALAPRIAMAAPPAGTNFAMPMRPRSFSRQWAEKITQVKNANPMSTTQATASNPPNPPGANVGASGLASWKDHLQLALFLPHPGGGTSEDGRRSSGTTSIPQHCVEGGEGGLPRLICERWPVQFQLALFLPPPVGAQRA